MKNTIINYIVIALLLSFSNSTFGGISVGLDHNLITDKIELKYTADTDYSAPPFSLWNSQVFTFRWTEVHGEAIISELTNKLNSETNETFGFTLGTPELNDNHYYMLFFTSNNDINFPIAQGETVVVAEFEIPESVCIELINTPDDWIENNNGTTAVNAGVGGEQFTGFSSDGQEACNIMMPVELTQFKALPENNHVLLNWTTHTEVNSSYFEVQHSTTNRDWQTLWKIDAAGNSLQLLDYEHIHHSPVIGDNYYRLKMIDLDGSYEYSDTEVVRFKRSDNRLTIYPNPTNGEFTVALGVEARHPVQLSVIDATGRMIYTEETILNGTQNAIIDLSHVAKGTYLVTVKTDKEQFAKRLIVY